MGDVRVLVFRPVGCVCGSRWSHGRAHAVECYGWRVVVRAVVPVGRIGYRVEVFLSQPARLSAAARLPLYAYYLSCARVRRALRVCSCYAGSCRKDVNKVARRLWVFAREGMR